MQTKIKILLIDDHSLFRSGLKFLLNNQEDIEVIGEAQNGSEGIKLAQKLNPDIILLDLDMPRMGGKETLQNLLNINPDLNVLILTVSEDNDDLIQCMTLGAKGYLLKNINTDFLLDSIHKVYEGNNILSPAMISTLIDQFRPNEKEKNEDLYDSLTPREKEILAWLTKGISNKEIARFLSVSESTIKLHVQNILRKLNLHSRVQAAIYALEHGFDKTP
ncbi:MULTISPECIES: response regulator transcription factor [Commensalibacter]|uniref:response regulator n=1 Tax=Commensalibacter TaxID=1079922 RepID=UPI0012D9CA1E|nr:MULTISPECIES: response regulator transcription factor [Commensalibacter]MCT6842250.1 response regulator transcription factor [Commensalibacter sp.]MBH9970252.1 response regulator transcription factor [Commensalibacter sp. M0265]MBH9977562.1 response regulator transcription factor [Commensalibacter sp. M0266]MBH9993287.1 response regulator transcription factor [Commensalibacter sp. M0270]MBI0046738.1 response regulator transcription factor [Commensalibacter sp. M0267]